MAALTAVWRPALVVAGLVGYALVSNGLMVHAVHSPWTVALLFGPLLLAIGGLGWRRRQWLTLAACGLLLLVLAGVVWRGGVADEFAGLQKRGAVSAGPRGRVSARSGSDCRRRWVGGWPPRADGRPDSGQVGV